MGAPPAQFFPPGLTPTLSARSQINQGQPEVPGLGCRATGPEAVGVRKPWDFAA